MALYQLDIQKAVETEYWTNRYFINADGFLAGAVIGQQIAAIEKTCSLNYVDFISLRVSTPVPDSPSAFYTETIGGVGARSATAVVPLTICARVELVKGFRRPDVRYLRGIVQPADFQNVKVYTATFIAFMQDNYCDAMLDVAGLVDRGNAPYLAARLAPNISQHQLRAGTRRKTTPVIPVA